MSNNTVTPNIKTESNWSVFTPQSPSTCVCGNYRTSAELAKSWRITKIDDDYNMIVENTLTGQVLELTRIEE